MADWLFSFPRSIRLEGELTSVNISQDSQFALINHAPDVCSSFLNDLLLQVAQWIDYKTCFQEIHMWDLRAGRLGRKYTGQRQGRHVIRSCFGGVDGNFIVSGSEGMCFNSCSLCVVLTFLSFPGNFSWPKTEMCTCGIAIQECCSKSSQATARGA